MFDSNAMLELAHIKRDRYERNGNGGLAGGGKVYRTAKAYHDAIGFDRLRPFDQARVKAAAGFREVCTINRAQFSSVCFAWREGYGDTDIPF